MTYTETLDFAYELRTPNPLGMSSRALYRLSWTLHRRARGRFRLGRHHATG